MVMTWKVGSKKKQNREQKLYRNGRQGAKKGVENEVEMVQTWKVGSKNGSKKGSKTTNQNKASIDMCTVRPTTGLFRTVEPNSPRTVYGLPLYRFDLCYIVYMVRNTIFHHDKVLPLGLLRAYGLPDAPQGRLTAVCRLLAAQNLGCLLLATRREAGSDRRQACC